MNIINKSLRIISSITRKKGDGRQKSLTRKKSLKNNLDEREKKIKEKEKQIKEKEKQIKEGEKKIKEKEKKIKEWLRKINVGERNLRMRWRELQLFEENLIRWEDNLQKTQGSRRLRRRSGKPKDAAQVMGWFFNEPLTKKT